MQTVAYEYAFEDMGSSDVHPETGSLVGWGAMVMVFGSPALTRLLIETRHSIIALATKVPSWRHMVMEVTMK